MTLRDALEGELHFTSESVKFICGKCYNLTDFLIPIKEPYYDFESNPTKYVIDENTICLNCLLNFKGINDRSNASFTKDELLQRSKK